MQFHYVVGYDAENDRWFVESDPTAYFSEGNVWDQEKSDSSDWGFMGWGMPEEGSHEEALDEKCYNMLNSLVSIWPSPVTNGEL